MVKRFSFGNQRRSYITSPNETIFDSEYVVIPYRYFFLHLDYHERMLLITFYIEAPDVIAALRLVELNPKGGGVLKDGKTVYPYKKRDLAKYLGLKEDSMSIRDLKGEIGSLLDKRFRFRFHYAWGKYTPASRDSLIYTIQQRYIKKPQHKWAKDYFKVRKLLSTMATDRRRGYRERKRLEGSWDRKMKQHCACGPNSISIFRNVGRPLKDGERYDFYSSDDFSDSDMPVSASARRPLPHDAPQGGKLSTQQKRIAEKTAKKNSATKRSAKRVRSGPIQVESDSPGPDSESGSQSAAQSDDDQDPLSWSSSSKEDESSDEEDTEKAHTTRVALSSSDSEDENGETSSDESSIPSGAEEEEDVEEEEEEADVADDEEEQENEELAFEVFAPEEWESGTESQESDDPEGLDDSAEVGHGVPASPTSGIKPSNKTETSDNKGLPSPTTLLVPIAFAKTWEKISASQAPQSITKQQSRNTNYDSSSSVIHLASPDTHRGTSSKLHTPRLLPAKSKSKRTDTKKNNLLNSDKSQQSQRQPKSSDLPSSFDPDLGTSKRGRKRTFSKAGRDLILEEHKKKKKLKQSKKNAELKNKRKETAKSLMDTYGDLRSGDIETDEDPTHTRTRTKKSKK